VNGPSTTYRYFVIASRPARTRRWRQAGQVWLSTEYVRAAPGGTGAAKCGGNYAAAFVAQAQAVAQGCDQCLAGRRGAPWVEEMVA